MWFSHFQQELGTTGFQSGNIPAHCLHFNYFHGDVWQPILGTLLGDVSSMFYTVLCSVGGQQFFVASILPVALLQRVPTTLLSLVNL
jgi:hypothetical protein